MIYLFIAVSLLLVLYLLVKKGQSLKKVLHLGGIIAVIVFILRSPAAFLNLFNILLPLFLSRANNYKYDEKIASRKADNMLTDEEAREILGVGENADEQEIKSAFKKLMIKNHPDQGGSGYIANKLVKARDKLLRR